MGWWRRRRCPFCGLKMCVSAPSLVIQEEEHIGFGGMATWESSMRHQDGGVLGGDRLTDRCPRYVW